MADRRTRVQYYADGQGRQPVTEFLDRLGRRNPRAAAKIDDHIEHYLNDQPSSAPPPSFPISSQVKGRLRELRIRFANTRYRVYYERFGDDNVLLHAAEKNTQRTPARDVETAMRRSEDWRRRHGREPPAAAGRVAPRNPRTR